MTVLGWDPATPGPEVASTGPPRSSRSPSRGCEVGRGFISALTVHGPRGNQGAPSGAPCDGFSGQRQGTLRNSWPGVVLVCVDTGCLPLRAPGACRPRIGRIGSGPVYRHCRAVTQTRPETGGPRAWGVQTHRSVTPTPPGTGGPRAWGVQTRRPVTPTPPGPGARAGSHGKALTKLADVAVAGFAALVIPVEGG